MTPSFSAAVSALVYSIVRERCAAKASFPPNLAVDYVLRCHRRLPDFMRLPLLHDSIDRHPGTRIPRNALFMDGSAGISTDYSEILDQDGDDDGDGG